MSDRYETFVRWYLRFNGYFCVENFVLHKPVGRSVLQDAEFDVLGVRFPYSREEKRFGTPIQNDPALDLANDSRLPQRHRSSTLIDFVIAEVKSGRPELNEIWNSDGNCTKTAKIEYLLRWMGPIASEDTLHQIAIDLQREHWAVAEPYSFRMLRFVRAGAAETREPYNTRTISFADIAGWIVSSRTPCWRDCGLGARSAHDQWDSMIKAIWECGNPKLQMSPAVRIERILQILAEAD